MDTVVPSSHSTGHSPHQRVNPVFYTVAKAVQRKCHLSNTWKCPQSLGLIVLPVQGCLECARTASKAGIETGLKRSRLGPAAQQGAGSWLCCRSDGSASLGMEHPPQAQRCHGYAGIRVWSRESSGVEHEPRSALPCTPE